MQIKNGKIFVKAPAPGKDFKSIFLNMVAVGAGRKVDKNGRSLGPWTPELLAEEMSLISRSGTGVDVRSVQRWFRDNEEGINKENSGLLAEIFGCGDVSAENDWRAALSKSTLLLVANRNRKRLSGADQEDAVTDTDALVLPEQAAGKKSRWRRMKFARHCESLFVGQKAFSLVIFSWTIYVMIGLVNFIFGLHSITYSPLDGLDKQVGFLWAPTWTILPLVILPLFIIVFGEMLTFWSVETRSKLASESENEWPEFVSLFSLPLWAISMVSIGFVFGLQWFGIYARIYWLGDVGEYQVDRTLITLLRPDDVSTIESIIASLFGFMYAGWFVWIFLVIMLFMYIITADFRATIRRLNPKEVDRLHLRYVGNKLMLGVFQCAVLGIWIAMSIKLQGAYLSSDSANILAWLLRDGLSLFSVTHEGNGLLENQTPSYFTTSLMLAVVLIVVSSCMFQIARALHHPEHSEPTEGFVIGGVDVTMQMIMVLALLSVSLLSIGQVVGFSLVLFGCSLASIYYVAKLTVELN